MELYNAITASLQYKLIQSILHFLKSHQIVKWYGMLLGALTIPNRAFISIHKGYARTRTGFAWTLSSFELNGLNLKPIWDSYLVVDPLQMLASCIGHYRSYESRHSPLDQVWFGQQGCCQDGQLGQYWHPEEMGKYWLSTDRYVLDHLCRITIHSN